MNKPKPNKPKDPLATGSPLSAWGPIKPSALPGAAYGQGPLPPKPANPNQSGSYSPENNNQFPGKLYIHRTV